MDANTFDLYGRNPNGIAPGNRVIGSWTRAQRGPDRMSGHSNLLRGTVTKIEPSWRTGGPLAAEVLLDGGRGMAMWHCNDLELEPSDAEPTVQSTQD